MPRTRRLVNGEEKTAYHIMSRTALDGLVFLSAMWKKMSWLK